MRISGIPREFRRQVGCRPTITIDWEVDSDHSVTLPVGLGVQKMVRIGKMPMKIKAEVNYSIVRPDAYGPEWTFRLQFNPVIPSPFAR